MVRAKSIREFQAMGLARSAKETLKASLGAPEWLKGIGIGGSAERGYHVKVNVASEEARHRVTSSVGNIPVVVEVTGAITAAKEADPILELRDLLQDVRTQDGPVDNFIRKAQWFQANNPGVRSNRRFDQKMDYVLELKKKLEKAVEETFQSLFKSPGR